VLDEQPAGTSIEYSILDEAGNPLMGPIYLGSDLRVLGSRPIRFHAAWSTTDPLATPLLHEWGGIHDEPTAVDLASFSAQPRAGAIVLAWETASELETLGFDLYRGDTPAGEQVRLNQAIIPARAPGSPHGAVYAWEDAVVEPGHTYYYTLEAIDVHGARVRHGPVSAVAVRAPHSVYLPLVTH